MKTLTAKDVAPFIGSNITISYYSTVQGERVTLPLDYDFLKNMDKGIYGKVLPLLRKLEDMSEEEMVGFHDHVWPDISGSGAFTVNQKLSYFISLIRQTRYIPIQRCGAASNYLRGLGIDTEGWIEQGLAERREK